MPSEDTDTYLSFASASARGTTAAVLSLPRFFLSDTARKLISRSLKPCTEGPRICHKYEQRNPYFFEPPNDWVTIKRSAGWGVCMAGYNDPYAPLAQLTPIVERGGTAQGLQCRLRRKRPRTTNHAFVRDDVSGSYRACHEMR